MGCIQSSYIFGRLSKIDIREHGSKNAGASNAYMVLGWKKGVMVALIDILKSAIPVLIVRLIFKDDILAMTCGVGATLGHIFPAFMGFKGGKGTASIAGMMLGINPLFFIIVGATILIVSFISNYIVIGTLALHIASLITLVRFGFGAVPIVIYIILSIINMILHIPNFRRVLDGSETKFRDVLFGKDKSTRV